MGQAKLRLYLISLPLLLRESGDTIDVNISLVLLSLTWTVLVLCRNIIFQSLLLPDLVKVTSIEPVFIVTRCITLFIPHFVFPNVLIQGPILWQVPLYFFLYLFSEFPCWSKNFTKNVRNKSLGYEINLRWSSRSFLKVRLSITRYLTLFRNEVP